jgi:hypothetical protein
MVSLVVIEVILPFRYGKRGQQAALLPDGIVFTEKYVFVI